VTVTPDAEVGMTFTPAPISKADARQMGLTFCEASQPEREALLLELGPIMTRRSLLVFADLAAVMGERDTAEYARNLRDSITTLRGYTEAAS
jgi:hypothetical protein